MQALLRRDFVMEYVTLGWNVAGIVVLAVAAVSARSVALADARDHLDCGGRGSDVHLGSR
jgi:hypothetical protein